MKIVDLLSVYVYTSMPSVFFCFFCVCGSGGGGTYLLTLLPIPIKTKDNKKLV